MEPTTWSSLRVEQCLLQRGHVVKVEEFLPPVSVKVHSPHKRCPQLVMMDPAAVRTTPHDPLQERDAHQSTPYMARTTRHTFLHPHLHLHPPSWLKSFCLFCQLHLCGGSGHLSPQELLALSVFCSKPGQQTKGPTQALLFFSASTQVIDEMSDTFSKPSWEGTRMASAMER